MYRNSSFRLTINEHINWYRGKKLLETCHLFEPSQNSEYRIIIEHIAECILKYQKYTKDKVHLYKNNVNYYTLYELDSPFIHVRRLHIIDKLKIYVNYNSNTIDAYSISDISQYNESEFNVAELPLYKSIGTHINVLSIVLDLPHDYINEYNNEKENEIIGIISHELQHVLDLIGTHKMLQDANKGNQIYDEFTKLYKDYVNCPLEILDQYIDDYILTFRNISYYIQKTEIHAHIESVLSEIKRKYIKKETILQYCKQPETYDTLYNIPTLYNYVQLYKWVQKQINGITEQIYTEYEYVFDDILEICQKYKLITQKQTYCDLLKLCLKRLQYFFNRLGTVIYVNY